MMGIEGSNGDRSQDLQVLRERIATLEAEIESARLHSEGQLRASEDKYRFLVENQTDLVVRLDPAGRFLFVSPSFLKTFGQTADQLLGQSFLPLVYEKDRPAAAETLANLKEPPHAVNVERRVMTKQGLRWFAWSATAVLDPSGMIETIIGVGRDVTPRKEAELALREQENSLRLMFENSPIGITTVFPDGRYRTANQAFCAMLGYTRAEILQRTVEEVTHPDDRGRNARVFEKLQKERIEHLTFEKRYRHKNGSDVWAVVHASFVFYPSGEPWFGLGMTEDVTDKKRSQREKQRLEMQLQHAQKLESLGVLAGGIAHDFNNMLMSMLGNADLALLDMSPVAPARESVEQIRTAAQRAAELCQQLLAYSGKGKFVIEPVSLSEIVGEMSHLLVIVLGRSVLSYELDPEIPAIDADATQMRQVVMNLITNAAEALGSAGGEVTIRTGTVDCDQDDLNRLYLNEELVPGRYVFLEVSDTGCGMTQEEIARIFDPFYTTKFTGRGLGLAAVLGIVRGHHGAFRVDSEVGQGTRFRMLLPISKEGVLAPSTLSQPADLWRGSGTVLVVDDDESVSIIAQRMLERLGFSVKLARDGFEALELVRKRGPEFVLAILDMTMPGKSGEETFLEIRRTCPELRVILSSGYNLQDAVGHFIQQGLSGFIQKPYQLDTLRRTLREVLSSARTADRSSDSAEG